MKKLLTTTAAVALLIAGVSGAAQAQTSAPTSPVSGKPASAVVKGAETVKAGGAMEKKEVKEEKKDETAATGEEVKTEEQKDGKAVKTETKEIKKTTTPAK